MANHGPDATPPVKRMKNSCWRTVMCQSSQMIYPSFRPKPLYGWRHHSESPPSHKSHLETRAYLLQLQQLDYPDSSALAVHSTANSVGSISESGAEQQGIRVCRAWFFFFYFIKNSSSWNPLLVTRVFNQTRVHYRRARCCIMKVHKTVSNPMILFWELPPLPTQTKLKVCDSCLCFYYLFQDLKVQNHILEKPTGRRKLFLTDHPQKRSHYYY